MYKRQVLKTLRYFTWSYEEHAGTLSLINEKGRQFVEKDYFVLFCTQDLLTLGWLSFFIPMSLLRQKRASKVYDFVWRHFATKQTTEQEEKVRHFVYCLLEELENEKEPLLIQEYGGYTVNGKTYIRTSPDAEKKVHWYYYPLLFWRSSQVQQIVSVLISWGIPALITALTGGYLIDKWLR